MIDELTFLIIITEHKSKGQYNKAGNDHIIKSSKVLDLEHELQEWLSELEHFLWTKFLDLVSLYVTIGYAHFNVLGELLSEAL